MMPTSNDRRSVDKERASTQLARVEAGEGVQAAPLRAVEVSYRLNLVGQHGDARRFDNPHRSLRHNGSPGTHPILSNFGGLAPIAHDNGTMRGKLAIGGGRRQLRHVMFQAALFASHHNPVLNIFADRLRDAGKPHKVVITGIARKLVSIANARCKSRLKWTNQAD